MKLRRIPTGRVFARYAAPRRKVLAADPQLRERLLVVAAAVIRVLSLQPAISLRKLRVGVRAALGRCTDADTDAAVELLGEGICFDDGPRGAWEITLDPSRIPADLIPALVPRDDGPS